MKVWMQPIFAVERQLVGARLFLNMVTMDLREAVEEVWTLAARVAIIHIQAKEVVTRQDMIVQAALMTSSRMDSHTAAPRITQRDMI